MAKYKVIQYATGTTGKIAIRAMANHPELELVGCLVHDQTKVGKDIGEIAGVGKLGVTATDKIEDILTLRADAVSFMGLWPNLDLVCPMLESGKHVAMTCGLIFPPYLGDEVVKRLDASCRKGEASVYGGGISPGFVQTIAPISLTDLARRVDKIVSEEFVDFQDVPESPELLQSMLGLGRTLEDVRQNKHPYFDQMMPDYFNQTVALLTDAVKLPLDKIEADIQHVPSPKGGRIATVEIAPGTIGGVMATFTGYARGEAKIVVRLNWAAAADLRDELFGKDRLSNSTQWRITLEGDPSMRLTFEQADSFLNPRPGQRKSTDHSFIITVMNVLHAIPYLCEDKDPGIKHHGNMPLMAGRYTMR
jgi:hypothetical protein